VGAQERGHPHVEVYRPVGVARQKVAVAPERRRPRLDALAADRLPLRLPVVVYLQGAEAELADVDRVERVLSAALFAA
jgi:hypothetical protein